jgi:tetratricopeptide (TPR) repeat protein/predicted Ser/Thr protein kinase
MIPLKMAPVEPNDSPGPRSDDADAPTVVEAETKDGQTDALDDVDADLAPGTRLGRYVVLEELGAGGMGMVFAAYDPELNRKVALKLLRARSRERKRKSTSNRLLQEAQALAKLAHPNVITVYDVGTYGEQVFVAMELVEGDTLRGWMREKQRRWDEVLEVFIPAGRGLAAAHAANLVHRDFKPENVLIGRDGRVRVMDFGLARPMRGDTMTGNSLDVSGDAPAFDEDDSGPDADEDNAAPGKNVADPLLTQTGSTLGTPAYMAPEQHLGKPTDHRSDQFSFCVSLFHALFGVRPFDGNDAAELTIQKSKAKIIDPPGLSRVPIWVRRHVWRGLEPDPSARFESMEALLEALSDDPRVRRRKVLAIAGATIAVAGGVGGIQYWRNRAPEVCRGGADKLAAVWSPTRADTVGKAVVALGQPGIEQAWKTSRDSLDRYGESWTQMFTEACEATHVRGEQSARLLELRQSCLQERLDEIDAWATLLSEPTAGMGARTAHAAMHVSALSSCADTEALASAVDPPQGDALRDAVAALRADLAKVKILAELGEYDEAVALARSTYDAAATVDYPPVFAEARFRLGQAQGMRGDTEKAEENLEEAQWKGASVKHDAIAAAAASALVHLVGRQRGDHEDGLGWSRHAEAAIKRIGARGSMEARLLHDVGVIRGESGDLTRAATDLLRAIELYQSVPSSELDQIDATRALGDVRLRQGKLDAAQTAFEEARTRSADALGEGHPDVAVADIGLARVLDARGKHDEALATMSAALTSARAVYPSTDPALVPMLEALAQSHAAHGDHRDAVAQTQTILELQRARLGDHPQVAEVLHEIGGTLEAAGSDDDARDHHTQALRMWERTRGKDHPDLAFALTSLGLLDVRTGDAETAVDRLERALKLRGGRGLDPNLLARTQFALAQALHATGGDHPRARELATKARDTFAKGKRPDPKSAKDVERWLVAATEKPKGDAGEDASK